MWKCPKCKEECEDNFDSCWSCGTGRDGSPSAEPFPERSSIASESLATASSTPMPSKSGRRSIMSRYTDAYLVARAIIAIGATVKVIAFVVGGGITLIALLAGAKSAELAIGGVILGTIVTIPIYILGILVTAQGQILKATLDCAVNGSPLLTKDEIRQIMSLD
jgi:hypothetical protein